jgi:hypothetical protein
MTPPRADQRGRTIAAVGDFLRGTVAPNFPICRIEENFVARA